MTVLCIDTATSDLVVGLGQLKDGHWQVRAETVIAETRQHNELLIPTVEQLLAAQHISYADLTEIVVGCGPGPFTGLRVGISTALALGQALNIEVVGVCSHDGAAAAAHEEQPLTEPTVFYSDAKRKEIYYALYQPADGGVTRIFGPDVRRPDDLSEPSASAPARLAQVRTAGLLRAERMAVRPLYLRRPDAQVPREKNTELRRFLVFPEGYAAQNNGAAGHSSQAQNNGAAAHSSQAQGETQGAQTSAR